MTEWLTSKNPCRICQKSCSLDYECEERANYEYDCIKKLEEYENAERQGRLVILPCKIGTPIYAIRQSWNGYNIDRKKFSYGMIGKFEKTVFLTREEAEKALKEMEVKA